MIIASRKSIPDIKKMLDGYNKILVVGCGTCVTVCYAGGEKEAAIVASGLRIMRKLEGKPAEVEFTTIKRQCEWEFIEELAEKVESVDAIVSMACGAGIQALGVRFKDKPILPGVDTKFIGIPQEQGQWVEKCAACGDCILDKTGDICPVTLCSKSMLNAPCGNASPEGKCELDENKDCAWVLIYERMKELVKLEDLEEILDAKDWSKGKDGGVGELVREDMKL